jgi:hypothetical protein
MNALTPLPTDAVYTPGTGPTLDGFLWFLRNIVGIPSLYLPDDAPIIPWAYQIALDTVLWRFKYVPTCPSDMLIYTTMVYNLATHNLIMWAPDVQPPPDPPFKIDANGNPIGFFQYLRSQYGLGTAVAGMVQSTFDQGTGTTLMIPKALQDLTLSQLQLLKTPWGAAYLGYAQGWNRPWGLT